MPVITASRELTPEERVISEQSLERLRKQEKDAQRHAEYMHANEVADNALGAGLSLLNPSTYINYGANALGVKPLNFGESLAVDFLTPGLFGALGKAGKLGKLSKLADRVVDVVPLLDRYTTVGGRFGRYESNLLTDIYATNARRLGLPDKARLPSDAIRKLKTDVSLADDGQVVLTGNRKLNVAAEELPESLDLKLGDPYRGKWPLVKKLDRSKGEIYSPYEEEFLLDFMDPYYHEISKNLKDFEPTITKYAKTLPPLPEYSEFEPNDFYIYFVNYYRNLGYDVSKADPADVIKIIEDNYKQLNKGATGELAGRVMWHGSPARYEILSLRPYQIRKVEEASPEQFVFNPEHYKVATSFSDIPGIYFGVQPFTSYGIPFARQVGGSRYSTPVKEFRAGLDMQPYLINGIKGFYHNYLPDRFKGVIPKNTAIYSDRFKGNSAWQYTMPDNSEITVPFGTSIKSLYPHPNAFVTNSDGTVTLQRDWSNPNLHYKVGGKLNYFDFIKSC